MSESQPPAPPANAVEGYFRHIGLRAPKPGEPVAIIDSLRIITNALRALLNADNIDRPIAEEMAQALYRLGRAEGLLALRDETSEDTYGPGRPKMDSSPLAD